MIKPLKPSTHTRLYYDYGALWTTELTLSRLDLEDIVDFSARSLQRRPPKLEAAKQTLGLNVTLVLCNLNSYLGGMTQRMTQRIADGPNRHIVVGSLLQRVVFVKAWYHMLALPVSVTVIALILLVCAMRCPRASVGTELWKSSALALLFYQVTPSEGRGFWRGVVVALQL